MGIISNAYEYGKTVAKKIAVESLKMKEDSKGTAFIMYIVGAVIAFYVLAALVPGAITEFKGANTTAFSAGELGMWGLITLMFIVGLVLMFVPGGAKGRR